MSRVAEATGLDDDARPPTVAKPMKLAGFEAIATALDDAGVRYLVAGGLAVNAHGYLRFTKDVENLRIIESSDDK